jgi:hypothetical protein
MKIAKILKQSGTSIDRVLAFLNTQPDDEIFTTSEMEEALGNAEIHSGSFRTKSWLWKDYTHKMAVNGRFQSVWGNRKSIAQLRKQLAVSEENHNED